MESLVFLDESGANTQMQRIYGWALSDQRAYGVVPHGHYVAVTMVAAIRLSGPLACRSFVGSMNADRFRDWVETALCPCLHEGDVVAMDNLSVHKDKRAIELIEGVKARVIFFPPYSPDLNPDEKLWSKTKALLRGMAERAVDGLLKVIDQAVAQVTPNDCAGFFQSCGYA